jgi:hypothetical protein
MRKILFSCIFINCVHAAIPTMAIPNLVYNKVSLNPGSMYTADSAEASSQPNPDIGTIAKGVKYKLPGFNADVRGAIISSGRFRAVKTGKSDYILRGQVSAISANEDSSPIKGTDKYTNQYNIDIAVEYKLVKTSDNSVMSAFTAYAHANDVKILTNSAANQKLSHNIPLLIQTASKSLGEDVVKQLSDQFNISSENYDNGSKVITDVKIYK